MSIKKRVCFIKLWLNHTMEYLAAIKEDQWSFFMHQQVMTSKETKRNAAQSVYCCTVWFFLKQREGSTAVSCYLTFQSLKSHYNNCQTVLFSIPYLNWKAAIMNPYASTHKHYARFQARSEGVAIRSRVSSR